MQIYVSVASKILMVSLWNQTFLNDAGNFNVGKIPDNGTPTPPLPRFPVYVPHLFMAPVSKTMELLGLKGKPYQLYNSIL